MLEDDFNDVLNKAIRGHNHDPLELGRELEIDPARLQHCLDGEYHPDVIKKLAPFLNLNTSQLLNLSSYKPDVSIPDQIKTFISPFGHLGVNAHTVKTNTHLLIFDTGTNAQECIKYISQFPEKHKHLFITHRHQDHIECEDELNRHTKTSQLLKPETTLVFGDLNIKTFDVAGHMIPASAYLITGLQTPVCIVGDAIFAGSMGGVSHENYQLAQKNIRENLLTLSAETILLSGHGPPTSVGLELENNPFF